MEQIGVNSDLERQQHRRLGEQQRQPLAVEACQPRSRETFRPDQKAASAKLRTLRPPASIAPASASAWGSRRLRKKRAVSSLAR